MRCSGKWLGISLLTIALGGAAASQTASPEDLLRQGNAAFARGDYAAAVDLFTKAEPRATDPGLVACNKAAALYRMGNFRAAELLYRCGLTDASQSRRLNVEFGLANCLVQEAQDRNAKALREAIILYEHCQRDAEDRDFRIDVGHNLELAKLLLAQALTRPERQPDEKNPDDPDPPPMPPDNKKEGTQPDIQPEPGSGNPDNTGDKTPVKPDGKHPGNKTDQPPAPGSGNLPPVPDTDDPVSLPPEDAAAHLKRATERIMKEGHQHRLMRVKAPAAGVKDW
jgi:tetratricopeptide (TPR) repeat protein